MGARVGWTLAAAVPLAFLAGWLGTITSRERGDYELALEMEVRSMTGAGAGEEALRPVENPVMRHATPW